MSKQTKITKSSSGQTCKVRIPFVCNRNEETTVPAHINGVRFNHGMGQKVSDLFMADCCSSCHEVLDGRVKSPYSKNELKVMHYEGVLETQSRLLEDGLVVIAC